ncbi:MAG: cytochrome c biogenesis protein CcsA [Anaerolineae bacterium]|nr:cytochrome c biogenesis protein CcsA [Anaerolineae bacterium]
MTSVTLFRTGTLLYGLSAYLYVVSWFAHHPQSRKWATGLLLCAVTVHALTITRRMFEYGYPFFSLHEVVAVYALALGVLYLLTEWRFGYTLIGPMITPLGSLLILFTGLLPRAHVPLLSLLQSTLLITHMSIFFAAYAAFTLAFAAALAYLLQDRALRRKKLAWRLPPLTVMGDLGSWAAIVGIVLMTVAIVLGSVWAMQVWGTPWVWEPKQVMSLITLGIYGLYFYARHVARWSGRRLAWLIVWGFVSILLTFIGADLLAPTGLHSILF